MSDQHPNDSLTDEVVKRASAKRTRRSFLVAGLGAVGAYEFYRWIDRAPGDQLIAKPLRKALNFNEELSRALFREHPLSPTYSVGQAKELRINGNYGLKQDLVLSSYRLQVAGVDQPRRFPQYVDDVTSWNYKYANEEANYEGHDTKVAPKNAGSAKDMSKGAAGVQDEEVKPTEKKPEEDAEPKMSPAFEKAFAAMREAQGGKPPRGQEESGESDSTLDPNTPGLLLTMDDVTRLPHEELVTQFKCIEGWSEIVHWGGVRLRDFIEAYPPAKNEKGELPKYVYMETPNGDYYTAYELAECTHPQSLLVTAMGGKPISQAHGAPLRLHMPTKYGYKQIKRIGLIAYTDLKPDDYWTKLGYDWYAGL